MLLLCIIDIFSKPAIFFFSMFPGVFCREQFNIYVISFINALL